MFYNMYTHFQVQVQKINQKRGTNSEQKNKKIKSFCFNFRTMPTYFTSNRHGYAVRFSRFSPDRLFVASSQYYGLVGAGTLYVLDLDDDDNFKEVKTFHWSDGLFDVIASEKDPNVVISVSGDGTLQLWNLDSLEEDSPLTNLPQMIYKEHKKEVYSIDWLSVRSENFILSASWDMSIKLWDPNYT
jgi:peroxin-7